MRTADNPNRLPPGMREQAGRAEEAPPLAGNPMVNAAIDLSQENLGSDLNLATSHDSPKFGDDPQPTWEPIEDAPHDGRDVHVRYGADDAQGRVVRWRNGRRFHNRRWQDGGRWVPFDDVAPLPADEPTEWLKMPGQDEPEAAVEAA